MAIDILEKHEFHLVLSDIMMPGMSGLDLLTIMRKTHPDIALIMVTAIDDRKTGILALELGAFGYIIKPFEKNEVLINVANALQRREMAQLGKQYDQRLTDYVENHVAQIRQRESILLKMIASAGARHGESEAHIFRVGRCSSIVAEAWGAGWTMKQCEDIDFAAALHDIGKIAVPDEILLKAGELTREERMVMEKHTQVGEALLKGCDSSKLIMAREIALYHHEKWDGSGYPHGLAGHAIPEWARVVAVCEVYDALTHRRMYREAFTEDIAVSYLIEQKGRRFDPEIVEVFLHVLPQIRKTRNEFPDGDWRSLNSLALP
jgi:putative two-component system response regulator